jgi:hypothetical protein
MNNVKYKVFNPWENNLCFSMRLYVVKREASLLFYSNKVLVSEYPNMSAFGTELRQPWLFWSAVAWVLAFHIPFSSSVFLLFHFLIPLHSRPFLLNYLRNFFISVEQPYIQAIRRHGLHFTHAVPFRELSWGVGLRK